MRNAMLVLAFAAVTAVQAALPPANRDALKQAWDDLHLGKWNTAEETFNRLVDSSDEETVCQARFARGNLWQHRRPGSDPARAAADFAWILEKHPQNPMASWSLLALGRIPDLEVIHPNPKAAIPLYRRVLSEYPETDAAQEAVLHLAGALWQARGKDGAVEAVRELARWRTEHPNPKYAAQIELLLGRLHRYPIEDYRAAVTHLAAAFDLGLASLPQRTSACWTVATLAEHELHDRDLAVRYYTRFLKEFPNHRTVFMAKQALKRLESSISP